MDENNRNGKRQRRSLDEYKEPSRKEKPTGFIFPILWELHGHRYRSCVEFECSACGPMCSVCLVKKPIVIDSNATDASLKETNRLYKLITEKMQHNPVVRTAHNIAAQLTSETVMSIVQAFERTSLKTKYVSQEGDEDVQISFLNEDNHLHRGAITRVVFDFTKKFEDVREDPYNLAIFANVQFSPPLIMLFDAFRVYLQRIYYKEQELLVYDEPFVWMMMFYRTVMVNVQATLDRMDLPQGYGLIEAINHYADVGIALGRIVTEIFFHVKNNRLDC